MEKSRQVYEEQLKAYILEVTNRKIFPAENNWTDDLRVLGFDSISAIRFLVLLEEKFDIEFEVEFLMPDHIYNFNHIMNYIWDKVNK